MGRLLRALLIVTAILFVGILVGGRILLGGARAPEVSNFDIGLNDVRRLARSGGALPLRVNSLVTGSVQRPRVAIRAGAGFDSQEMVRAAYQVVYADGTLIIDSAMDRVLHDEASADAVFHEDRYAELQAALLRAETIVVTHEHADHIGGISRSPHLEELLPKLVLTREQLSNRAQLERSRFPQEMLPAIRPLDYLKYHRAAPGVVLIKAPGHTPGTQLVFVALKGGRELLFVGDIAWHMDNVERLTGRPLLVTRFFLGEDRDAVLHQLRALYELWRVGEVELVVAHDADQLRQYVAAGLIGAGFE